MFSLIQNAIPSKFGRAWDPNTDDPDLATYGFKPVGQVDELTLPQDPQAPQAPLQRLGPVPGDVPGDATPPIPSPARYDSNESNPPLPQTSAPAPTDYNLFAPRTAEESPGTQDETPPTPQTPSPSTAPPPMRPIDAYYKNLNDAIERRKSLESTAEPKRPGTGRQVAGALVSMINPQLGGIVSGETRYNREKALQDSHMKEAQQDIETSRSIANTLSLGNQRESRGALDASKARLTEAQATALIGSPLPQEIAEELGMEGLAGRMVTPEISKLLSSLGSARIRANSNETVADTRAENSLAVAKQKGTDAKTLQDSRNSLKAMEIAARQMSEANKLAEGSPAMINARANQARASKPAATARASAMSNDTHDLNAAKGLIAVGQNEYNKSVAALTAYEKEHMVDLRKGDANAISMQQELRDNIKRMGELRDEMTKRAQTKITPTPAPASPVSTAPPTPAARPSQIYKPGATKVYNGVTYVYDGLHWNPQR